MPDPILRDPIATDAGPISGTTIGAIGKEVRVYRGIPYAAPPVGELRWKPPQPVTAWSAIRECTRFSAMAPQPFPTSVVYDRVPESGIREDCLHLNVLTPARRSDERLPVMVWFHGGGLTSGWGNTPGSNGAALPQAGAVVVTVNHRLGPIGYLAHPALSAESGSGISGNYGSLDLVAALQWVQKNIAAFGGDPGCVTIFGVSGGGQKVLWCMASPLARGLFQRAIVMSGGIGGTPLQTTEQQGEKLAAALGISAGTSAGAETLAELRARPWQEIIAAASRPDTGYATRFSVDGWSLHGVAADSDVPLIVGFVGSEKAPERSPAFIARAITPAIEKLSSVRAYVFTHIAHGWGSAGLLAYHGGDVAYAFGAPELVAGHYGNLLRGSAIAAAPRDPGLDARDRWVSRAMLKMFVGFARSGTPELDPKDHEELGKTWTWPLHDARDLYLDVGVTPEVRYGWSAGGPDQQKPRY